MKSWGASIAVVGLVLVGIALAGLEILFNWRVEPMIDDARADQARHFEAFREDLAFIEQSGLLPVVPESNARDAGKILNDKVRWVPAFGDGKRGLPTSIVDRETTEWLLRVGGEWMTFAEKNRKIKADLSLFSGLRDFDVWDIESESPIADLIASGEFVPPTRLPIPETSDLIAAAKLRLIQGHYEKQHVKGLEEIRKFAMLLMTTENMELQLTGLALLDHERSAYNFFVRSKAIPAEAWRPFDRNVTRRAQRALLVSPSYLRTFTPSELVEETFLATTPPGLCASVNEALPLELSLRPMLEPQWPLEKDFRAAYERLDKVYAKARQSCRLRYLAKLVETGRFADVPGFLLLNRLPYSRKVFGARLSTVKFGGFDAYSEAVTRGSTSSASN